MAPTLTPPAFIPGLDTLTAPELQARIDAAQEQKGHVDLEIKDLRRQLDRLVAEQAREAASRPPALSLSEMLQHPSYENDYSFAPSATDEMRLEGYEDRQKDIRKYDGEFRSNNTAVYNLTNLQREAPKKIEDLRQEITRINRNRFWRLLNQVTGTRERYAADLAATQEKLAKAPQQIADAKTASATAQEIGRTLMIDKPYDLTLHDLPAKEFLPRDRQSVLLSYESGGRFGSDISIRMPSAPEEIDFTRGIIFRLDRNDALDFIEMIGDVPVKNGMFSTLKEEVDYEFDVKEELVPFALEVVEIDGKDALRIPQAVWERFGAGAAPRE